MGDVQGDLLASEPATIPTVPPEEPVSSAARSETAGPRVPPDATPDATPEVSRTTSQVQTPTPPVSATLAAPRDEPQAIRVQESVERGLEFAALGQFDDAEQELRRALSASPSDPEVRAGLGILSFRRGLYGQAETELGWVCAHDPEHGPAHLYRGEALNRLGRVDEALEMLGRVAELQPDNYRAYYLMGILFDRKSLREAAAAMYRKARELQGP